MKHKWLLIAALLVAVFVVACGPFAGGDTSNANKPPIKIGFDGSLTGATADWGVNAKRAMEIAIKEYNDKGGYKGQKVEGVYYDDQVKPDLAVQNVTRLIEQDKIVVLTGLVNTGNTLAIVKIISENKIALVIPVATGSVLTQQANGPDGKNYIFRVSMADVNQVALLLDYATQRGWVDKVAIFNDTTGYGTQGLKDVQAGLDTRGQKPVTLQSFQVGDTDMTAQVNKAKEASAKVILTYALPPENAGVFKSMAKVGYNVPVIGAWGISGPATFSLTGNDILSKMDLYTIQSHLIDQNDTAKALHDKMLKTYNEDPFPIAAAQQYDAIYMIFKALDAVGPDSAKLRDAIENIDGFSGATSTPAKPFGPTDHEAIELKNMFVSQVTVVDGKTVKLVRVFPK